MTYRKKDTVQSGIYSLLIFFISVAVYEILMRIHAPHYPSLYQAALGVLDGKPHWIAYQNRLLGPSFMVLVSKMGMSYEYSLKLLTLTLILVENFLLFSLLRKAALSRRSAIIVLSILCFAFLLVQDRWFYTWDSIDIIIFTLFVWGVLQKKSLPYFLVLFGIGLLNRESALFIALYITINAFHFKSILGFHLASTKQLAIGLFLIVAGIIYIKLIRSYLFISQPDGLVDSKHELIGNHVYILTNIKDIFFDNLFSTKIINSIFIVGASLYLLSILQRTTSDAIIKAILVFFGIIFSIMFFSTINETRMYIILLPFLVFIPVFIEKYQTNTSLAKNNGGSSLETANS